MTQQEPKGGPMGSRSSEARNLTGVALARIATSGGSEAEVARDLQPVAADPAAPDVWRIELARLVAALVAGGLVEHVDGRLRATVRGLAAAAEFLGVRKMPLDWPAVRDSVLVAKALGLEGAPPRRLKLLAKAEGLRAMIVVHGWRLEIKGPPTPSRLRSALAVRALERAFGNQIRSGLGDRSELPAKAGRMLAGQLSTSGRVFGTDARLIAALAAELVGVAKSDVKSLQLGVLRSFIGRQEKTAGRQTPGRRPAGRRKAGLAGAARARLAAKVGQAETAATPTIIEPPALLVDTGTAGPTAGPSAGSNPRPDPEGFAKAVLAATAATAEGWSGNRRAFISKVWAALQARHPEWALTEIEFKCMLAEAHRTGLLTLANADLKDKLALAEIQQSAVVYKNTVWHYVRADH